MHERHPALLGAPPGLRTGLVVAALDELDLAAVLLHGRHLGERRLLGHHEQRVRAGIARREGDRLGVIAGAGRDDAGRQLVVRQAPDHVRRTARLERSGELQVLGLEQHAGADATAELTRGNQRSVADVSGNHPRCVLDVGMGDGVRGYGHSHPALSAPCPTGAKPRACLRAPRSSANSRSVSSTEVAQVAVPRHWDRGEVIFREGDQGDTCYLLRTGAVVLTREHQDGRMVALAELRAGALFGELAMFRGETRSATAEAIEATTAVALLASDMQRLIRRSPGLSLKFLATLAERVSRTNERLLQQSFQTVAGRVASALLAQVVARQAEGAPESDVLVRSTQAEIANLAGTSRESASRFLATLERAEVVTLGRGKVTVHDPGRLRNYIH